ncbi:protein DpdJ [Vibrio sinaloensis]|uniref:protein DpdJ n=1 Tax=Photobacterium sp. (strain ATCC 43367) TaxID=379097 RepID=UPI002057BB8D|nr:protein DpdJ [Vibrio sinaloensis]UPQ87051.1 DEAD/DEAH box helicase [Vibrio sinaloensis]
MSDLKKVMLSCLDDIEERETELLAWGDTSVSHTEAEILAIIHKHVVFPLSAEEVLQEMDRLCYLFSEQDDEIKLYRTRMAQTVRLQVASRQWFHGQSISKSKTLVSDFRFLRRRRRYPMRTEASDSLIQRWKTQGLVNQQQSKILDLLLTNGSIKYNLSGFQVRSTERILRKYGQHLRKQFKPSATIVCSGTGSGKTLSFYLPAITSLAIQLLTDSRSRVRILAIYPRKELLKDQFSETYAEVRKLDAYLQQKGCRKIQIGTYFSDTFYASKVEDNAMFNTMACPEDNCKGKLRYRKAHNRLECERCSKKIDESEIGLTRESIEASPPDILFTTTEMLNQRLSDNGSNHLFGVDTGCSIPVVLMDEVHTYEGTSGAQVSYLLKRWMKRSNIAPHFVGLSATLDDAEQFFADLTSTYKQDVELIEPKESEMEEEGAEYMLALKGDPVSQTALLSTTIQSTMLTSRMLDPLRGPRKNLSDGVFGQKVFVFTDDLDVINRLYNQLRDAEGWRTSGAPKDVPSLVFLRSKLHPDFMHNAKGELRSRLGLDWEASSKIGHDMTENSRGNVGRTSSQDTGVNNDSEMVVATASLEVGFNDPQVGAIVQHKAPRGVASYLQRKGRAGRKRGTRPWMYTILSDYGRDRVTFQQYEHLVSPKVKSFSLPVHNAHVQKMQASVAIIDLLSKSFSQVNIWRVLAEPKTVPEAIRMRIKRIVERWVETDSTDLEVYLKEALKVDSYALQHILWASPRSIMMDFLPSLLHKLETNWALDGQAWAGLIDDIRHPMPEFIPANLFSELHAASIHINLERGSLEKPFYKPEEMGIFAALKEFAPGRVSKRFDYDDRNDSDWLVPDNFLPHPGVNASVDFDIEQAFFNKEHQVYIADIYSEDGDSISVYQPVKMRTQRIPTGYDNDPREYFNLAGTSNSQLRWRSQFRTPNERGESISVPQNSDWAGILTKIAFYTHDEANPVEVIRYSTGADAELKFKRTQEVALTQFNWVLDGNPVAVGARLLVDGVKLVFQFTDEQRRQMASFADNKFALRFSYIEDSFVHHIVYKNRFFFAKWVFECVTCALTILIEEQGLNLDDAVAHLSTASGLMLLKSIPSEVFNLVADDDEDDNIVLKEQALQERLVEYFDSQSGLQEILQALDAINHNDGSPEYQEWIKDVLASTVSGGISNLILQVLPDVSEGSVVVDHYWSGDEIHVWITESEVGGIGIVHRFKEVYAKDPLNVVSQFSQMFSAGESEQVDFDLYHLLNEKKSKPEISNAFDALRRAVGYAQRVEANKTLNRIVSNTGIFTSHSWSTMLHSRVFKPGSDSNNDSFLCQLLTEWREIENKVGMEVPLVIVSHLLAKKHHNNSEQLSTYRNFILGLLWPRGNQIRQARLESYNRFANRRVRTERLLLTSILVNEAIKVTYDSCEDWAEKLEQLLGKEGRGVLVIPTRSRHKIGAVSALINTMVIDMNGLLVYPRISMIKSSIGLIEMNIELAESLQ